MSKVSKLPKSPCESEFWETKGIFWETILSLASSEGERCNGEGVLVYLQKKKEFLNILPIARGDSLLFFLAETTETPEETGILRMTI